MQKILDKIRQHGLFDAQWYVRRYGGKVTIDGDPLQHFLRAGLRLGLDPSPSFDREFYIARYPDVAASGQIPFLHYLLHGIEERRLPAPACSEHAPAERLAPHFGERALDLGCGSEPRNPFAAREVHGVDIRSDPEGRIRSADLAVDPIPYDDAMFDVVTAYDFIEHVPRVAYTPRRRFCFVELMNEISRVLKPGGVFLSHTPAYPAAEAFRDPTHVNIITEETFLLYFDCRFRLAEPYGYHGRLKVVHQSWCPGGTHIQTLMRKA